MAMYINQNLVQWMSKKQKNITKSTAAAELIALSTAEERTVNVAEFLKELGMEIGETKLYEDNQAVIAAGKNEKNHSRRSVDIGMKKIRESLAEKIYTIEYVTSERNIADMFTKALPAGTYRTMVKQTWKTQTYQTSHSIIH
ncbi:hypothetical protein JCM33374_g3366 [Metschnikowia sp. JCM 33374]|nr:hypothetical protein JCM33374_g3366 [Metschnikowia sp. JCM 33374]